MKKIFLLTIVFIAAHNILSAQFSFGIHTGVDINNVAISGVPNVLTNPKTVIVQPRYGVHGILDFSEQSSVKAELNYIKRGFSFDQNITDFGNNLPFGLQASVNTTLNYIEVPILYKHSFKVSKLNLALEAGPSVLYGLSGDISPKLSFGLDFDLPGANIDFADQAFNRTAIAANVGLGLEMPLAKNVNAFVQTRYNFGLTDLVNIPIVDIDTKTRTASFGVGITYAL